MPWRGDGVGRGAGHGGGRSAGREGRRKRLVLMVAGNVNGMAGSSNHLQQGRGNKGMVVVPWGGGEGEKE